MIPINENLDILLASNPEHIEIVDIDEYVAHLRTVLNEIYALLELPPDLSFFIYDDQKSDGAFLNSRGICCCCDDFQHPPDYVGIAGEEIRSGDDSFLVGVILHEIAHTLTRKEAAEHGEKFLQSYVRLMVHYEDASGTTVTDSLLEHLQACGIANAADDIDLNTITDEEIHRIAEATKNVVLSQNEFEELARRVIAARPRESNNGRTTVN